MKLEKHLLKNWSKVTKGKVKIRKMWILILLMLLIAILTFGSSDKVRKKRKRSKTPPRKSKREQLWTHYT